MKKPKFIVENVAILSLTPLVALIGVPWYGIVSGYTLFEWSMFFVFLMSTGLAITAGYHRLWSHRTYKAHAIIRVFYALFGAASLQNSILHWSADHRNHHRYVDDLTKDPYSAKRGFWFSHIGWILRAYPSGKHDIAELKDLQRDPIVRWQHRWYIPLAIFMNLGLPLFLGYLHNRLWGTFFLAGILRMVLNHHFTFFINSLAHMWGSQSFSTDNSARDNGFLAIFTYGEGYHNFHHRFQSDYRNGIAWYHYDPAKWLIRTLSWIGLADGLKTMSPFQIEKAKILVQREKALRNLEKNNTLAHLQQSLEEKYHQAIQALEAWSAASQEWQQKMRAKVEKGSKALADLHMKERYQEMKLNFQNHMVEWKRLCAQLSTVAA
ncbi:MAG: fatty acid desaturase [Acidobacteria bacterium]|nr:fatty acid desaturase [Acidobacteriota bacterium]MCB9396224.1 fatty acid desaturase [Acidobacteriota bacterium]